MEEAEILIKVHKSYRTVVAVCDKEIYGRKLLEGNRQLDLTGDFFNGKTMNLKEARENILDWIKEDATFNIVGEKSLDIALKLGIVKKQGIMRIQGVPFALILL